MCLWFYWLRSLVTTRGLMKLRGGGDIVAASEWSAAGVLCRPHMA